MEFTDHEIRLVVSGILAVCAADGRKTPEQRCREILRWIPPTSEGARAAHQAAKEILAGRY